MVDASELPLPSKLKYAVVALVSALLVGTVFYHYFEKWTWLDSAFFSTSTLTTVGYGNMVPLTPLGKLFTIPYMVLGIGIALYALSMIGGYYVDQRFERRMMTATEHPRRHLKKLRCMIQPGSEACKEDGGKKK